MNNIFAKAYGYWKEAWEEHKYLLDGSELKP